MTNIIFNPPPGLFTDDTDYSSDGKWVEGSNVRPWNGRMQVIGGWRLRAAPQLSSTADLIREWKSSAGTNYVAYGCRAALRAEVALTLYDITPAAISGTFSTARWSFANYGDTLIANFSGAKIYQWLLNTATPAAQVTNAPVAVTCILVTPERQLLAFGCNEEGSGTFNQRCIRGSNIEDITDWTTTATNNAFEHILDGATSSIVTAKIVGQFVAVWTQSELFLGQFLGDPSQTYRFDKVATNCGALSLNSVTVVDQTAYWISPELQFHVWTPGTPPVDIPNPTIDFLRANILTASQSDTFSCHVAKYDEVWFNYPKTTSPTFQTYYAAYCIKSGLWFKGKTERTAMHQGLTNIIAADNSGNRINCETGAYGEVGSFHTLEWSLGSADYYIDNAQLRMMLRSVWPDFEGQLGNVTMTIKTSEYPQGAETSQTALTFTSSTTKKDFRASGRIVRVTFSGSDVNGGTDTFARFGAITFDAVKLGQR